MQFSTKGQETTLRVGLNVRQFLRKSDADESFTSPWMRTPHAYKKHPTLVTVRISYLSDEVHVRRLKDEGQRFRLYPARLFKLHL
jgi:hypothetical protein